MLRELAVMAFLAAPSAAFAWGAEGHEIVAGIASQVLAPAARAQVAALLGSEAMLVHDSNWADEVRDQYPPARRWHFVDIPLDAGEYDARRDCNHDDCVVAQIARDRDILANSRLPPPVRAQALRFLIPFVADVHQPLHAEDNGDHGGNAVRVYWDRERTSLHHIWDVTVVEALGYDAGAIAGDITRSVSPVQRKAWQSGTAASWANEAHQIARDDIYRFVGDRRTVRLPRDYADAERSVTRLQLARAGFRLAWLLNGALN